MTNITKLYTKDAAKNPDNVLEQAIGGYESVFIVGYDHEGNMDARASTNMEQRSVLWLIESFKSGLVNGDFAEE